jgi:hypothetical protein
VRADEAGVGADVHEWTARPEHADHFAEQKREVLDVGVRPNRDSGVETRVLEWKVGCIRPHDLHATLSRQPELVLGDVDPDGRPPVLGEHRRMRAGSAPDVEQSAWAVPEKSESGLARYRSKLGVHELSLVPLGDSVVARVTHSSDASLDLPGCLVVEAENTPAEPDPANTGEGS